MAKLLVDIFKSRRALAQVGDESFSGLETDENQPIEPVRKICTFMRCGEEYYPRYRFDHTLIVLVDLSK